MGIRLQGGFTSVREGFVYVINIHDSEYSGSVVPFDVSKDGVTHDYDHQDKGRNVSVMTSKLKIRMLVKNADIFNFMQAVVDSAEGRFRVEVLRNGSKHWYGYVMPDLFDLQDKPYSLNPVLTIMATDGIGRLKKIDYNNAGSAYTGKATFLDHLYNILDKIGFDDFYSAGQVYLTTFVDWWEENQVYNSSNNPFELSRFDHRALIEVDRGGEVIYNNAYDVLEQLVKEWNCRFLFSNGAYHLIQINSYTTDGSTKVLKHYDKEKTKTTTSTTDFGIWNKTTGVLSSYNSGTYDSYHNNGRFRYYPALRKVEVKYEHYSTDNFIPGYTWSDTSFPTATFSAIDFNDGAARLVFNTQLETRADFDTQPDFQVCIFHFRIQFKVGNKYLTRGFQFINGRPVLGDFAWSDSIGYVDIFSEWMYIDNSPRYVEIGFVTPLLQEGGDMEVILSKFAHYNTQGNQIFTGADNFSAYYNFQNTRVQIFVEGNLEGQTNIDMFTATNDDGSTNSETEELSILVGDGPSGNTFGAIETYDDANWVSSTGWRKGSTGSYVKFGQLLANEILAGQVFAIERYIGQVTGDYMAHERLVRTHLSTAINYVFIGGSHNLHQDVWAGEWIQIDVDNLRVTAAGERRFVVNFSKPRRDAGSGRTVGGVIRVASRPSDFDIPLIVPESQPEAIYTVDLALNALFPRTNGNIDDGDTVTQIPIPARTVAGEYRAGQTITLIDPYTGAQQDFTVTADTAISDTSISVSSQTAAFDFRENSWIVTSQEQQGASSGSGNAYRQQFASHASDTITVTVANLPANAAAIRLYFDNGQVISPSYWSHVGNVITLTYTPPGVQSIWVEFIS